MAATTPAATDLGSQASPGSTAHQVPTEAEIREAVAGPIARALGNLHELLANSDALAPIIDSDMALVRAGWREDFYPPDDHPGTLWADLTKDEANELQEAISATISSDRFADLITDQVVAAALEFARRHPDVPRGRWRPS